MQITYWNSDGIIGKGDELVKFLQEHAVDVIPVKETHLKLSKNL